MTGKEIQWLDDFEYEHTTVYMSINPWWTELGRRLEKMRTERRWYRSINWPDVRDHGAKHLVRCGRCIHEDHDNCLSRERCSCDVCV